MRRRSTDKNLRKNARDLEVDSTEQPWEGDVVTITNGRRVQREAKFGESPAGAGAMRFLDGGAHQIITGLKDEIDDLRASNKIDWRLNTAATEIRRVDGDELEITLSTGAEIRATCVVFACPPRAVVKVRLNPPLPPQRQAAMDATMTWMSSVLKFVVVYDKPFWKKDDGCSGFGSIEYEEEELGGGKGKEEEERPCLVETAWDASDCQTHAIAGEQRTCARMRAKRARAKRNSFCTR